MDECAIVRVRLTIWGAIAGLAGGACLLLYEAAGGPVMPGWVGSLVLHAVICAATGGVVGFLLDSARAGKR